jgi:protocatechuate 3,4-dioxygenase beta subunit
MKTARLLLACLLAAGPVLFGFQAESAKGSIEGQVVDAKTNAPIKRAAVTLQGHRMRGMRPGQPPPETVSFTAESDASGNFAFRDLEAGNYFFRGQRQGYVEMPYQGYPAVSVVLGRGHDLKGVTLKLTPQAVITGKVLDENGEAVQGAQVAILRRDESRRSGSAWNYAGSGQTSDLGEYRVAGIAPGSYVVRATWRDNTGTQYYPDRPLPAAPDLTYVATHYPSALDVNAATAVTVEMGAEVRGIDIRLRKAQTVRIRGRLEGMPVSGGGYGRMMPSINLVSRDATRFERFGSMTPTTWSSDSTFEIRGALPGAYLLIAQMGEPNQAMAAVQPIEVADKHIDGVVLRFVPSRDVQGTIVVEEKTPVDLGFATVGLTVRQPVPGRYSRPVRITDRQFTLKDVLPIHSSVEVNGLQPACCYVKAIRYGGRPIPPAGVDLTSGEQLEIVVSTSVAELAGTVVDADGKSVSNSVVALISSDATVWPQQTRTRPGGDFSLKVKPGEYQVIAWGKMDMNMNLLTPEFRKHFAGRTTPVKLAPGSHETIRLTITPPADIAKLSGYAPPVRRPGSMAGTVVDAKSGAPVKNATVSLGYRGAAMGRLGGRFPARPPAFSSPYSAETDEQGRFSISGIEPGYYPITAERSGYAAPTPGRGDPEDLTIVGDGQQLTNVVVKVDPQAVIAGKIVNEYGEPLAYARVAALRNADNRGGQRWGLAGFAQTDDRGEYRITNLPPGSFVVRAIYRNHGLNHRPPAIDEQALPTQPETIYRVQFYPDAAEAESARLVEVAAGAEVPGIDMKLQRVPAVRVRGKLTGEEPGGRAVLQLVPKKALSGLPPNFQQAIRGPEGAFEFHAVRPGSYYLIARNPANSRFAVQSIEIGDKHIDGLTLELTGGREVRAAFKLENYGRGQIYFTLLPTIAGLPAISQNVMDGDTMVTLSNVAPIPYTINENLQPDHYWKSIVHGGRPVTDRTIDFGTAGLLEITVSSGAARVEGSVIDLQGKSVPNAAVALVPVGGAAAVRTGSADAQGKFYFASLAPGDYRLVAWVAVPAGRLEDVGFVRNFAGNSAPLSVAARERKTIQVTANPAPAR